MSLNCPFGFKDFIKRKNWVLSMKLKHHFFLSHLTIEKHCEKAPVMHPPTSKRVGRKWNIKPVEPREAQTSSFLYILPCGAIILSGDFNGGGC